MVAVLVVFLFWHLSSVLGDRPRRFLRPLLLAPGRSSSFFAAPFYWPPRPGLVRGTGPGPPGACRFFADVGGLSANALYRLSVHSGARCRAFVVEVPMDF